MRLIDADTLEEQGWIMQRTVAVNPQTMEMQMKKPTDFPTIIDAVPNEKFTDKEKRIFLAAMGRELDICEEVDREFPAREAYEDTLESVCREITRKVKGALWT